VHIALKFIRLDRDAAGVELRVLEAVRNIHHPNLLDVQFIRVVDDCLAIATPLCDESLIDRLRASPAGIPGDELLSYMEELARAVDFLNEPHHRAGDGGLVEFRHGDIKPHNIFLVGGSARLADFGEARMLAATVASDQAIGSPTYAAPEVFGGRASRHSDQYSLAVTYVHLRTGRLPFTGASVTQIYYAVAQNAADLSGLPDGERLVVARALAKEPEKRWPSCQAFVATLKAAAGTLTDDGRESAASSSSSRATPSESNENPIGRSLDRRPPQPAVSEDLFGPAASGGCPTVMPKVFISYRRDDSAGMAGRLYDRLQTRFGAENVFMDIDTIPLGVDFREHLESGVRKCDVVVVILGRNWAARTPEGGRRLDDPKDFVRIEIEAALARGIPVIPVLVDQMRMPAESELPPGLAGLAYRNAIEVAHGRDFHVHVDRLIKGIELMMEKRQPPESESKTASAEPTAGGIVKLPETADLPRTAPSRIDDGSASGAEAERAGPLHGRLRGTSLAALAGVIAVFVALIVYPRLGPPRRTLGIRPEPSPPGGSNSSLNPETVQPPDAIASRARKPEQVEPRQDSKETLTVPLDPDEVAEIRKLPPDEAERALKQRACPVSGENLGSMGVPVKVTAAGRTFYLCCKGCNKDVQEDPAAVVAKLKK
jgi:serine/threonine protein kinase